MGHWFVGARYSFMDLKSSATVASLNQSEYLLYAIYNFTGKLKGLSIANFCRVAVFARHAQEVYSEPLHDRVCVWLLKRAVIERNRRFDCIARRQYGVGQCDQGR
ncbi:hypothetical protein [Burkholderia sp. BE17]|uniref:hypothetical protein n=1 Tax=Burkholderia sp. BE17 TaxID=2656644 RepID=UPI001D1282FB|nr:hypothetical protein [Burkholderia sp. BE17]